MSLTAMGFGGLPAQPPGGPAGRLLSLDCVRGVAALLVCIEHLRNATVIDFSEIESRHPLLVGFYFMSNLGHEAVMVFFVLSGFLVGGSVVRAGRAFCWTDYLLARAVRLWCVVLPCLMLTWLCDRWLASNAPSVLSGAFAEAWHSAPLPGGYDASLATAIGNALFVQTVWVPVFGSNGPLWSLANEAWYYLLFPLVWSALRGGAGKIRALHAMFACLVVIAMPAEMRALFLVWMLGVAVAMSSNLAAVSRYALVASALAFAAAVSVSRLRLMPSDWQPLPDYLVGLTFAWFCLVLVKRDRAGAQHRWIQRTASWLSDISFSLYVSHFPLVLVIAAANYQRERMQPDALSMLVLLGWLVLLLCAAHAMWWCFESRTGTVRAWLAGARSKPVVADESGR